MVDGLTTTSYAVLGLLSIQPMSGYDLTLAAARSIANFWPISKSHVYRELPRLEAAGLVQGTAVAQEGLPDKRVFQLTPVGSDALDEWLANHTPVAQPGRIETLVLLFFGHRLSAERLRQLIELTRSRAAATREQLATIVEILGKVQEARFARATALRGLLDAEATLEWCDHIEADLVPWGDTDEPDRDFGALFEAVPDRPAERNT